MDVFDLATVLQVQYILTGFVLFEWHRQYKINELSQGKQTRNLICFDRDDKCLQIDVDSKKKFVFITIFGSQMKF